MINFTPTGTSLAPADLDEIEQRFGFKFPQAFREHYLVHNGGSPDKNRFAGENGRFIVHDFLPMKRSALVTLDTLETTVQCLKIDQQLIPVHLVPFAVDPGGDYYCFCTRQDEEGSIYLYRMDHFREPERAAEYLAPSLGEFLSGLRKKGEA